MLAGESAAWHERWRRAEPPFCDEVRASGKNLGPSPLVNVPLSPGVHAIVLERGSVERKLSVEIKAGESRRLRVRMTEREAADPGD